MKYSSLKEYFYKMHNLLYLLMLVPLLTFVVLYWQILEDNLHGPFYGDKDFNGIVLIAMGLIVFSDWMASFFLFSKRLGAIRKIQSLGTRLDQYYSLTIIRFGIVLSGSLLLAVGFWLTENQLFTLLTGANLLLILLLWPLPSKVCRDLQLKGDERTLVLYKKDRL